MMSVNPSDQGSNSVERSSPESVVSSAAIDDNELLLRIRSGDRPALATLLDRYWTPLVTYAARIVGGRDCADDVAQEAFVRIWERREHWKLEGSVSALLYRITRSVALDERKRRVRYAARLERRPRSTRCVPTPADELRLTELEAAFEKAVAALPESRVIW